MLSEFERNLIRERTLAGLKARARPRPQWWPAEEARSQGTEDDSHSAVLERSARAGYRRAVRGESIDPVP
jgi:DNA invertase Pin-like site-specific DNA recombinase